KGGIRGSRLVACSLSWPPISSVANPCCNRVLVGVVPALVKAMRRRDFIKVIAGSAAVWPLTTRAQQPALPVIGLLHVSTFEAGASLQLAFRQGLSETGYIEGKNVTFEHRWAEGHLDRLASLAADLTRQPIAVLAGLSTPAALAAKAAPNTLPTVFST